MGDDLGRCLYIRALARIHDAAISAIGLRMLKWIEEEARRQNRHLIRLECDALNPAINDYYARRGFTFIRCLETEEGVLNLREKQLSPSP